MSYPPDWRLAKDDSVGAAIMAEHPFAHLITSEGGLRVTRVPFVLDRQEGRPVRLRAHLNAQNPQAKVIESSELMIVFSGPSTYVSPNWRTDLTKAATFDYQEVRVRGRATVEPGLDFFVNLVNDLAREIEPAYRDVGDYPIWQASMAPEGYVERLFPHVVSFSVEIDAVETISKLHQPFPPEDRVSIARHLSRSDRSDARKIAQLLRGLEE
jgi:transcriptional regulator